ncbi:fimbria/pilus outer membrane usher protein [Entomohabitans teleogrylli]|uniref:fimbria/pilus outer membrane usher protein n=1 Tax=Entomohabitans teleogrylli TaxID=1384589 RepID=UPI00073D713A|nr:fimbria/pilus outer membrane usher protein [Entomohabitans teleogrylli]
MLYRLLTPKYLFALLLPVFTGNVSAESNQDENRLAQNSELYFDQNMLVGGGNVENLNLLKSSVSLAPGEYPVDVYINDEFVSHRSVRFHPEDDNGLIPCLEKQYLIDAGVLASEINDGSRCSLAARIAGASDSFNENELRLNLFIPQIKMRRAARGAVPESSLDAGSNMMFVNYDANYYHNRSSGMAQGAGYLGLNSGINIGIWQLRQQSSFTSTRSDDRHDTRFTALNSWLQRPLLDLKSQIAVGDIYTSGNQFSSLGLFGIQLASDDRMLPDSQRGYAPTIRGIAHTNARVVVKQSGNVIHQTSVPPGEFTIDDLYPTSYQGDLDVEIQEADGRLSSFTVPFSAVPESVRPGQFKYHLTLGQIRNINNSNELVADMTGRYGVANNLTLSGGLRGAQGYQAALLGGVFTHSSGAYGINTVYSSARVPDKGAQQGWRFSVNYSKTLAPTNTSLSLAAFRHSTAGFYDLGDVLGARSVQGQANSWISNTWQQRNQFTATVSQSLGQYGHTYLSGSTSDYRGGRSNDTQLQAGYNFSLNNMSWGLSYARQKTGRAYYGSQSSDSATRFNNGSTENVMMLSLSMPLGGSTSWSNSYSRNTGSGRGYQMQSGLNGSLGENNRLNYGLSATYDRQPFGNSDTSLSGSLQKQFASATVGASAAKGRNYTQSGINARGAAVAHAGGLSFGPYLGDSFALIEAKGAEGAAVKNAQGARISGQGYALMPSLTPYRFNEVVLDSQGISNSNVELDSQSSRVAPYAGAMVTVKVKTSTGYPLLLNFDPDKYPLALGEDVYDNSGNVVGMVSQGGVIYARAVSLSGVLYTRDNLRCALAYNVADKTPGQPLYRATTTCKGTQ